LPLLSILAITLIVKSLLTAIALTAMIDKIISLKET
jgi:hypothetical protein